MTADRICPVCAGGNTVIWSSRTEARGRVQRWRCRGCDKQWDTIGPAPTRDPNVVANVGSFPCRIVLALQMAAIDGIATISHTALSAETGISLRAIGANLDKMAALGAIEIIPLPSTIGARKSFRVINAALVTEASRWSEARAAMVMERYPHEWNVTLTRALNALPGLPLTTWKVREWANKRGLQKSETLLATKVVRQESPPKLKVPPVAATKKPEAQKIERVIIPPPAKSEKAVWSPRASVFSLRGIRTPVAGPARPHEPGRCQWPLRCHGRAEIKPFCEDHLAFLKTRRAA